MLREEKEKMNVKMRIDVYLLASRYRPINHISEERGRERKRKSRRALLQPRTRDDEKKKPERFDRHD